MHACGVTSLLIAIPSYLDHAGALNEARDRLGRAVGLQKLHRRVLARVTDLVGGERQALRFQPGQNLAQTGRYQRGVETRED